VTWRLLDLFCGAGGASVGYHRAGFDVVGVDIEPHDDYPFPLHVMDWAESRSMWDDFDVVTASPPCPFHTTMSNRHRGKGGKADQHVNLIPPVRDALTEWGGPYVIENVPGARRWLASPVTYSGGAFGLRVERQRLFEANWPITPPPYRRVADPLGVYGRSPDGRRLFDRKDGTQQRAAGSLEEGAAAMGIDWMSDWLDVKDAIPPAYTEHIGWQLADHLSLGGAA
jgi:DNA (cytosine-5)-methyltransferase 1